MPQKREQKIQTITELEKIVSDIFVVNQGSLRPYLEVFKFLPENVIQQRLGILCGFFEVKEYGQDSAYITNHLTSALKKEYFSNSRRTSGDSFEAALHKVNLALSDFVKNGSINWMGHLDGAICVMEKNTLHLAITGNGKIFLYRDHILSDISEGMASDQAEIHPLKTFSHISSGRLEAGDKIIITSNDIFHIFSLAELKKSLERFPREKFIQFLKTALTNELETAGTLIIDIRPVNETASEKTEAKHQPSEEEPESTKAIPNAFSQTAYRGKKNNQTINSIPSDGTTLQPEYTDSKTGHIYIQGEEDDHLEEPISRRITAATIEYSVIITKKTGVILKKTAISVGKNSVIIVRSAVQLLRNKIRNKSNNFSTDQTGSLSEVPTPEINPASSAHSFLPRFSKIKETFQALSFKQKWLALSLVIAIIVIPFFFSRPAKKTVPPPSITQSLPAPQPSTASLLSQEKNITIEPAIEKKVSITNGMFLANLENSVIMLGENQLSLYSTTLEKQGDFPYPQNFGTIIAVTTMNDLHLVFILSDKNQLYSFSPTTKKYTPQTIGLPAAISSYSIGAYLTYLYVLDNATGKIYRYPRTENGFGTPKEWNNTPIALAGPKSLVVGESIFVSNQDGIVKLYRGEMQSAIFEQPTNKPEFYQMTGNQTTGTLSLVDKKFDRVMLFSPDGTIARQFHSSNLSAIQTAIQLDNNTLIILARQTMALLKLR